MKNLENKLIDGFATSIIIAICILVAQCALIAGVCAICGWPIAGVDPESLAYYVIGDLVVGVLVTIYWNIKDKLESL